MSDISITQSEADDLLKIAKSKVDDRSYQFPQLKGKLSVPLVSIDGRHKFHLDITRSNIAIKKVTYQNRARSVVILARLDTMGKHTNPDGRVLTGSHFHLYKEGYSDRWAIPAPANFTDVSNLLLTLDQFMAYCNVVDEPLIQGSSV